MGKKPAWGTWLVEKKLIKTNGTTIKQGLKTTRGKRVNEKTKKSGVREKGDHRRRRRLGRQKRCSVQGGRTCGEEKDNCRETTGKRGNLDNQRKLLGEGGLTGGKCRKEKEDLKVATTHRAGTITQMKRQGTQEQMERGN